jgi:hypothetical protein
MFSFLFCVAAIAAEPQGLMEGHLTIASPKAVEPSDNMPRQAIAVQSYIEYPLIVLSQDGERTIARVTADKNGNYRVALPAGAYILDVEGRVARRLHVRVQPFTIVPNQTANVDLTIYIGFGPQGAGPQE